MHGIDMTLSLDRLAHSRRHVVDYLRFCGVPLPPKDLEIAVGEVFQNVIRHAYPAGGEGRVSVEVTETLHDYTVSIRDYGAGFDTDTIDYTIVDIFQESGRGFPLIAAVIGRENLFITSDLKGVEGT